MHYIIPPSSHAYLLNSIEPKYVAEAGSGAKLLASLDSDPTAALSRLPLSSAPGSLLTVLRRAGPVRPSSVNPSEMGLFGVLRTRSPAVVQITEMVESDHWDVCKYVQDL